VLGISVVIGGWAAVALREEPDFTSDRQEQRVAELGWPDAWLVAHGPIEPGGDVHRSETWIYSERGLVLRFVDGAEVLPPGEIEPAAMPGRSAVHPTRFHRGLALDDIEQRLDEEGTRIEPFDSPYPGSEAYLFARSALLITLVDGRFFTAQTY
jgi:hypothetical protein